MNLTRFLPLSGVLFVAVVVLGVLLGGSTPDSSASAGKVMSYYDAHHAREIVSAFVLAASVPLLVLFASSLATALWPAEAGRRPVWELVLIGGGFVTGAIFLVAAAVQFAIADGAHQAVSANALQALNVLESDMWVAFNPALGVMMLGAAGSLMPRLRPYRWLGWAALVLGVALFIPYADFFALLLSGLWIIVASIMLFRERRGAGEMVALRMA